MTALWLRPIARSTDKRFPPNSPPNWVTKSNSYVTGVLPGTGDFGARSLQNDLNLLGDSKNIAVSENASPMFTFSKRINNLQKIWGMFLRKRT